MAIVQGSTSPTRGVATDQTLGFNSTTQILVRDVGRKVLYLDSSASPFTLLADRAGSSTKTNPRYEWYEKTLRPKATTLNGGGSNVDGSSTNTTLVTNDNNVLRVGDLVLNQTAASGQEIYRVASQSDVTTYVVTRGAAGTTATTAAADADDLLVIGAAISEGADVGVPDEWQEVQKFNFMQIFRTQFGSSGTRDATDTFFGSPRPRLRAESGVAHAIDIESAFLFGQRSEGTGTTNAPLRTTRGFVNWSTTNVLDMGNASIAMPDLEKHLETIFAHTVAGDSRTLFASARLITAIDLMADDALRTVQGDSTYGLAVSQLKTSHGVLNIVKHRLLTNGANGAGFGSWGLIVDPSKLQRCVLSGRDTKLLTDRQAPGVDGWVDEYMSEIGLQFANAEVHSVVKNVAAVA